MCTLCDSTGLFGMIVGVLTTCHTQYTSDSSICIFLFNRTTLQVFVTYRTGALYVHLLWFYKHQHDNRVRSKLVYCMSAVMVSMAVLICTSSFRIHTHPVSWNCVHHRQMELSDGGCFPNLVRNSLWTVIPRQSFWIILSMQFVTPFVRNSSKCVFGVMSGSSIVQFRHVLAGHVRGGTPSITELMAFLLPAK